jgi:hypothetical protein
MRGELDRLAATPVEGERHLREDAVIAEVEARVASLAGP